MKRVIGVLLITVGLFGFIGMFISKSGAVNTDNGIAYLVGRLSPIAFLIIGFILLSKKTSKRDN